MPPDSKARLAESLHSLIPDPLPDDTDFPDGADLGPLAAATPFVRRISAVCARLDTTDVLEAVTALRLAAGAAERDHIDGTYDHAALLAGWLLLIAGRPDVVRFADTPPEATPLITAGAERRLVDVDPAAFWAEAVVPSLLGDCDGCVLNTLHAGPLADAMRCVPALLFEVLARARKLNERDIVETLHRAAQAAGMGRRYGPHTFSRRRIAEHVATMRALLVELGVARWTRRPGREIGDLEVTPLGRFGYLIFKVAIDGPWPEIEALVRDAGYLPCNGGYVHRDDVPVDISSN